MAASAAKKPAPPALGWEILPADLLERICLRLPASDVCRLRAVCREWSIFLRSPVFLRNYAARSTAAAAAPWIVVYTDHMYAFVNSRRWLPISLSNCRVPRRHEEEYQADCVSDGALICISRRSLINENSVRDVFLYNPISKLRVPLPCPCSDWPQWRPWALCAPGPNPDNFQAIFLACSSPEMHLYAPLEGWIQRPIPKNFLQETVLHDEFSHTATCIGGVAYCINWDRSAVLTYNISKDAWGKIETPLSRHSRNYLLIEPQIVKGGRGPVLVAGVRKRLPPAAAAVPAAGGRWRRREVEDQADVVSIWDLDTGSMTWSKVCEKSCELPSYTLAGNEREIFVIPHGSGEVLAYDLGSKVWQRRPSIPSHTCFSMATFSLEARF